MAVQLLAPSMTLTSRAGRRTLCLAAQVRRRYVLGLQVILQRQLEVLVERYRVGALVCGVAGTTWVRLVAASKVFDEMWLQKVLAQDEAVEKLKRSASEGDQKPHQVKYELADAALPRKDYSKDLCSYLKYCKDVIFPGIAYSVEDKHLIEIFHDMYKAGEDENPKAHMEEMQSANGVNKRCRDGTFVGARRFSASSGIQRIKSEMEGHGFCYMPPRRPLRSDNYLHYRRKTISGSLVCGSHADYYILICAFAKLAEVDIRIMHNSVLKLERRLAWIEKRIGRSLDALQNLPSHAND